MKCRASRCRAARTTPRTCSSPCAASAHARVSACAACGCTPMAFPGTMPDGQGQFSQFDLGSADHIEVLRGPFSALYGNSSGGVIAIFTAGRQAGFRSRGHGRVRQLRYAALRARRQRRERAPSTTWSTCAHFQTDGYRDHSDAERNIFNAKVRIALDDASKLTLVANAIQTPFVQDPLGLTRAQLAADPHAGGRQCRWPTTPASPSTRNRWAPSTSASSTANDELSAELYGGHRETTQFQAIPMATEGRPPTPAASLIWRAPTGAPICTSPITASVAGTPLQLTAGVSYDNLDEAPARLSELHRRRARRRRRAAPDETNHVYDLDEYLQAQWDPMRALARSLPECATALST